MAEAVLGVVALWQHCVSVFDIIESIRRHGMAYERLCAKLTVERVRLLLWGEAVGLGSNSDQRRLAGTCFGRVEVERAVVQLLACMQQTFEDTERLQASYGLQPLTASESSGSDDRQLVRRQVMLGGVFQRAYQALNKMAHDRQRTTPLPKKTLWAVKDQEKFMQFVAEIRGFNDSLQSLFPDIKAKATHAITEEIHSSVQMEQLRLLQEATSGENDVISDTVSVRLEALGASVSERMELLSLSDDGDDGAAEKGKSDADEEIPKVDASGDPVKLQSKSSSDKLTKQLENLHTYIEKKSMGELYLYVTGPYYQGGSVSAHVEWQGDTRDLSFPSLHEARDKGFVSLAHASFELYHKKTYRNQRDLTLDLDPDSIDSVLLDAEAHAKYENVYPGTVTVEGFGLECWDFELLKPVSLTVAVNYADMPDLPGGRILRRLDQLRNSDGKLGWSPEQDELDMEEFVGTKRITHSGRYPGDPTHSIGDLYRILYRTDFFADFTTFSSIGIHWTTSQEDGVLGLWNLLRQVVIAKELARRLAFRKNSGCAGSTTKILASLIVADLWLANVDIVLGDEKVSKVNIKRPITEADMAQAEDFNTRGIEAMNQGCHRDAIDLFTQAMKLDLGSAEYRCLRSAALLANKQFLKAGDDAYISTQLYPRYSKAWSLLGAAQLKQNLTKRAETSFKRALLVAGSSASEQMRQDLRSSQDKNKAIAESIYAEKDKKKQHSMLSDYLDQDFDCRHKSIELHSRVHEQQVEGLLLFAERMKWPYINQVRDFAEDVYGNLRGGEIIPIDLHDWLFGLVLPGQWFAYKIMAALILSTPSINSIGSSMYYECGVSLSKKSYWRCRTVLGRVLGCLPGVQSLCGWVGPCPPVEFDRKEGEKLQAQYVHLRSRRLAPHKYKSYSDNNVIVTSSARLYHSMRQGPEEELEPFVAEMTDSSKWIIPEPPIRQVSTCELQSIVLKQLPLEVREVQLSAVDVQNDTQYRARLIFKLDSHQEQVTYQLYTNPVFVTLPPCRPSPKGVSHGVHMRQLHLFQKNIWTVEQLKDHVQEDEEGDTPMVINATGKGAELLARAWCSERGRNAVIRTANGPCFVCAVKAAGKGSLETGVLIWLN